jgi:hypothetical protein
MTCTFLVRSKVLILAFYIFVGLWPAMLRAETDVTGPMTLSKAGEYYRLTRDIATGGTAFTITANDITFDLDGHTVTYNTQSSGSSVYGVLITGSNAVVKNGIIVQGNGKSSYSHPIRLNSTVGHELHHLVLKPTGFKCRGIYVYRGDAAIHHVYIESHTTSDAARGDSLEPVYYEYRSGGGQPFHDNILVNGHSGVIIVGGSNPTNVYNNLIQPKRCPGVKAPFGIGLSWRTHNVNVYNNQIVSDSSRGIILDGWNQGVSEGASNNYVYDNRIDVQYTEPATGGYYVENNVFGLYDRYSSGDNTFEHNVVIVNNEVNGACAAVRIGSDAPDGMMSGIVVRDNTLVVREGGAGETSAFIWGVVDKVNVINNKYLADVFSLNNWDANQNGINIGDEIIVSGNTEINPLSYTPAAPTGLYITKFLNSYLLRWDDNLDRGESQTYEYIVYRDGQPLPISPRGGTFYVDVNIGGTHTYSVSALTLSGTESPKCSEVSTTNAVNGWWEGSTGGSIPPSAPTGLKVLTH